MLELGRRHGLVAAAAQTFHDDLNIARSQTAGGNIHAAPHLHGHKAGLHTVDGKQVVGGLGHYDAELRGHAVGKHDGTAHIDFRVRDKLRLVGITFKRRIEQFLHCLRLRAHAP